MPIRTSEDIGSQYNKQIYSSPFFDLSNMYMPKNFKKFFEWSKFFFTANGIINPVVMQMSRYPITGVTYLTKSKPLKKFYKRMFDKVLRIKDELINVGVDYHGFGNCMATVHFPFKRTLKCPLCKKQYDSKSIEYKFKLKGLEFEGRCPGCEERVKFKPSDTSIKDPSKVKIVLSYPGDFEIKENPVTKDTQYIYSIPMKLKRLVFKGDKFSVDKTPMLHLQAIAAKKPIIMDNDKLFHFKRPNMTGTNQEWGLPLTVPAMKKIFYMQILQKAQEAIAIQHIVPLTILFPMANAGKNPYETMGLRKWRRQVESAVTKWKKDPNFIGIMPFPVGVKPLFGNGRSMLVTPEVRQAANEAVAAMGVPQEFLFGGLSWSASSVNLRMLENQFLNYRGLIIQFLYFLIRLIAERFAISEIEVGLQDFKMIDDAQQKQLITSWNQMQKISDESLLGTVGKSYSDELEKMMEEEADRFKMQKVRALNEASLNNEIAAAQMKAQAVAQAEAEAAGQQTAQRLMNPQQMAEEWSAEMDNMNPQRRADVSQRMKTDMPGMYGMVAQHRNQQQAPQPQQPTGPAIQNSGNLPEQRAPRSM